MPVPSPLLAPKLAFRLSIASALGFACMNACARQAGLQGAHFTVVGAWRSLVGALVALGFAKASGSTLRIVDYKPMWKRTVFGTFAMMACFYVLSRHVLSMADTSTLFALAPVFVALLSPALLGEAGGQRLAPALALCGVGVLLILGPGGEMLAPGHVQHALIATGSAFFAALAMIYLRTLGPTESSAAVAVHFSFFACLAFVVVGVFLQAPLAMHALPWMLGAGLCAGLAQLLMTSAYRHDSAARVSTYGYFAIPFSAALEAVFQHRVPTAFTIVGALLVSGAGVWLSAGRPRTPVAPEGLPTP